MKFKTIVITKKKLTGFAAVLAAAGVLAGTAAYFKARGAEVLPVFNADKPNYEEILDEGLSNGGEFNIKSFITKLLGFDPREPETILKEFSPVMDDSTAAEYPQDTAQAAEVTAEPAENTEVEEPVSPENTSESISDPPLPMPEQIRTSTGLSVNNASSYSVDVDRMCAENLTFSNTAGEPLVLIVHTHTTECYDGDQMAGETERTTDDTKNVIEIGNVIQSVLEENGIGCVHDITYHDYPSYQGSYTRALSTIQSNLGQYPSIKIVLDVHRDAFIYEDGTNLKFAAKIQNAAQIMYPGLMRPINLRTERFNMHMTPGSLIMEVGSNGNTLAEAKEGAREAARAVAAAVLSG